VPPGGKLTQQGYGFTIGGRLLGKALIGFRSRFGTTNIVITEVVGDEFPNAGAVGGDPVSLLVSALRLIQPGIVMDYDPIVGTDYNIQFDAIHTDLPRPGKAGHRVLGCEASSAAMTMNDTGSQKAIKPVEL
jgi:hypothetical protein